MLDELFSFPVIRSDSESEHRKESMGIGEIDEWDTIESTAEYPYHHFVGIEDAWFPTKESISNARNGQFDACVVRFLNASPMLCSWDRIRFKKELKKFINKLKKKQEKDIPIIHISSEKLSEILSLPPSSKSSDDKSIDDE